MTEKARKIYPVGWSVNRETSYTSCEKCRQICVPILEVLYKASLGAAEQWHYLCRDCAMDYVPLERAFAGGGASTAEVTP